MPAPAAAAIARGAALTPAAADAGSWLRQAKSGAVDARAAKGTSARARERAIERANASRQSSPWSMLIALRTCLSVVIPSSRARSTPLRSTLRT